MSEVKIKHGTRGGYYAHRRLKSEPCDECREAINEYVREYREKNGLARNRERDQIRRKALATLRDRHRAEYEILIAEVEADMLAGKN